MTKLPGLSLALILITSCHPPSAIPGGGRPVSEVYGSGSFPELGVREHSSPLKADRAIPVLSPPEVFAVYVPTHVDRERDLMVGEHWVFFKLRNAEWFIEREGRSDPVASGPATQSDLTLLRAVPEESWKKILVPHK